MAEVLTEHQRGTSAAVDMKVTVSFDTVRLVVPCGDGQLHVGQLVDKAVARYCKTVGKVNNSLHQCRIITGLRGDEVSVYA